jgi:hypothetical protein
MLVNPFLRPPQVESPQSRSWGRGFAFGFQGPPASLPTPADVEDEDAFQQGVQAGQQAASNGFDIADDPCVDLNREGPFHNAPEFAWSGLEFGTIINEVRRPHFIAHIGGAVFSAVMFLLDLSIALQTHFDDPSTALSEGALRLRGLLDEMGITDTMELFLGGGVDFDQVGCELMMTPVFRTSQAALQAAQALGRNQTFVVKWRTDQSGGIKVVELNE